jgi:hypothetical protein
MKSYIITGFIIALVIVIAPAFARGEFNSIEELEKAYSDNTCRECHEKIHEDWKKSLHSQSVVHSLGGLKNFISFGLKRDWKKPVNRENLMRCFHCHAPLFENASDSLAGHIGELVISASEGNEKAKNELAKLNVNCIVCHNTVAAVEINLKGASKPGVYYGPSGKPSSAHGTEKSTAIVSSALCSRCHWLYTPPDGDTLYCNTLYGSYQDAYKAASGTKACQDCHMRDKGRGHTFPGSYVPEMVQEGIGIEVYASGIKLQPKGLPTAFINISLMNKAGHRIPDG